MCKNPSYLWVCDYCSDERWESLTIGRIVDDGVCQWCGRTGKKTNAVDFDKLAEKHGKWPLRHKEVIDEILNGLWVDGTHHKQYHLENALQKLSTDEYFDRIRNEMPWEEGVA